MQSATSGFAAACIGPVLNNPFDVVKVRSGRAPAPCPRPPACLPSPRERPSDRPVPLPALPPSQTRMQAASRSGQQYSGFADCLVTIARTEGLPALYKGIVPRLARTPPGQAIVWAVSDQITGYLEEQRRTAA